MPARSAWSTLAGGWKQAVAPHPDVGDPALRKAAGTTANLAIASLFGVLMTSVGAPLLLRPDVLLWRDPLFQGGILLAVLLTACLGLARSRWPAIGVHGLPWSIFACVWVVVARAEGTPWTGAPAFLLVVPALAALTLPTRSTIVLWLAALASFGAYLWVESATGAAAGIEDRAVTLILIALLPPILVFGQAVRDRQSKVIGEQAARMQEQDVDLRGLLDSAPNGTLAVDRAGSIVFANPQACTLFGYRREEMLGRNVDTLVPDAVRGDHRRHRAEFASDPVPRQMGHQRDLFGRRKDGTLVPIEIGLNPLRSLSGGQLVVASLVDLTGRKRTEALQAEAVRRESELQKAAAVARFRADLMNMVAHELKNPLTPIRLQMSVLRTLGPEAGVERREKAVAVLERNVGRLNAQINLMLEAARLESGSVKLALASVDLGDLVREAVDSYRPVAAQAGIRLERGALGPAGVRADRERLAQVLDNLLSNALKYTPAGGNVAVAAETRGGTVRVSVRDSGLGLTAEQRQRLFQPFSKVHQPVRATESSTGLGLFITRGILELHGGRIGVESEGAGRGSEFWFEVPVSGPPPAAVGSPAPTPGAAAS